MKSKIIQKHKCCRNYWSVFVCNIKRGILTNISDAIVYIVSSSDFSATRTWSQLHISSSSNCRRKIQSQFVGELRWILAVNGDYRRSRAPPPQEVADLPVLAVRDAVFSIFYSEPSESIAEPQSGERWQPLLLRGLLRGQIAPPCTAAAPPRSFQQALLPL